MALFGRRKPGFAKEVELKPSEIPDHFSDALDPAVNKELDNPKLEKKELQAAAAAVTSPREKPAAPFGRRFRPFSTAVMAISRAYRQGWVLRVSRRSSSVP